MYGLVYDDGSVIDGDRWYVSVLKDRGLSAPYFHSSGGLKGLL